jgi:predicted Zn finger-like uncharacterized protein
MMIEIQCTSCHTRYRIDERVLPEDTPTFKCSRCGHVFTAEPVRPQRRKPEAEKAEPDKATPPVTDPAPEPEKPAPREEPSQTQHAPEPPPAQSKPAARPETPAVKAAPPPPSPTPPQPQSKGPATAEIFNKSFASEPSRPDAGENLKFDFSDERHELGDEDDKLDDERGHEVPQKDEGWQVGDAPEIEPAIRARPAINPDSPPPPPPQRAVDPQRFYQPLESTNTRETAPQRPPLPDDVAFIEDTSPLHSSAWFIGMFFVVAIAFFGLSMFINGEPAASVNTISRLPVIGPQFATPQTPASLIRLADVHMEYRTLKGGKSALVVTGNAENVGSATLKSILIEVLLLNDSQRAVAREQAYCGNTLPAGMFAEMTPHELEFSLGLKPPKIFELPPSQAAPFMLVFLDPPPMATSLRIAVTQADPPRTAPES